MKRARRPRRAPALPKVENPGMFPAWVWLRPADGYDAPRKRGEDAFAAFAALGFRLQIIPAGSTGDATRCEIHRPWTFIFGSLPFEDISVFTDSLADLHCSVIMDCHFPIMDMENAIGADEAIINIIDNKDVLLVNLAAADVVTVPHPAWAEQLAAVNPNVFLLPDVDDTPDAFMLRLGEVAQASIQVKQARQAARREMGL